MFSGKTLHYLILNDIIGSIIDDVISTLKSYISRSAEFYDTQHSYISVSIHWFVSGLCTDPQVKSLIIIII